MTDTNQEITGLTVSREQLQQLTRAAYQKGKADALAEVVTDETRVSGQPSAETVEALLDNAFAGLRADLDAMTIRPDESA